MTTSGPSRFESPPFREGEVIEFVVDGQPKANRERVVQLGGHGSIRRTKEVIDWLLWLRLRAAEHRPSELWTGAVAIHCEFIIRRKKFRKKDGPGRQPHTARPDAVNCLKLAEDALKDIIIADDNADMFPSAEKWYAAEGESPHTRIRVTRLHFGNDKP